MIRIWRKRIRIKTGPVSIIACLWLAGTLAAPPPVPADIYRYVDDQGVLYFTNVPTSSKYRIYLKEKPQAALVFFDPTRYDTLIQRAAQTHGLDHLLVKSIIKAESNFNPRAVSSKGAMGLMQIMPENIKRLDVKDPFNPRENIMAGTRYLKSMLDRFDGKLVLALAAYHAGPTTVARYDGIPPYKSTEVYIKRVMKYYYLYKKG